MLLPTRESGCETFGVGNAQAIGAQMFATVTSGAANTYGSWTGLSPSVDQFPTSHMTIRLHAVETSVDVISATTLNAYVDIGVGPDSSNVSVIAEKLCGSQMHGLGCIYTLPLWANSKAYRLWARHQNTAASAKIGVHLCRHTGRRYPGANSELINRIVALGATTASTTGTSVTPGAPSPSGWTQIIASTTERYLGLMASPLFNVDTTLSNGLISFVHIAIGGSGSEQTIAFAAAGNFIWSTAEQKDAYVSPIWVPVPAGQRLSAQVTGSTTADASNSIMLYGLCG